MIALTLLAAATCLLTGAWWPRLGATGRLVLVTIALCLWAVLGAMAIGHHAPALHEHRTTAILLAGALGVLGGGPLTMSLLWLVDRRAHGGDPGMLQHAGEVLRGGAWIGALERTAVYACLVGGWPEGIAITLAVKGLGRYPELRSPGAAERFIIGTLTSVLWAAGCAGLAGS